MTERYRVGGKQPGNIYRVTPDHPGGERFLFAVRNEDGPMVAAALNEVEPLRAQVAELTRERDSLQEQLRHVCERMDRIRHAANAGPDIHVDDLIEAVRELAGRPVVQEAPAQGKPDWREKPCSVCGADACDHQEAGEPPAPRVFRWPDTMPDDLQAVSDCQGKKWRRHGQLLCTESGTRYEWPTVLGDRGPLTEVLEGGGSNG